MIYLATIEIKKGHAIFITKIKQKEKKERKS
jgi:hypothetical protein